MLQHIHQLEALNVLFLFNKANTEVLLLKRAANKRYYPNLYTGIGGYIELQNNEAQHLDRAMVRELEEETEIQASDIAHFNCDLLTWHSRHNDGELAALFWYSGNVHKATTSLVCTEGELAWFPLAVIPTLPLIDTAALALNYLQQTRETPPRKTTALAYIEIEEQKLIVVKER